MLAQPPVANQRLETRSDEEDDPYRLLQRGCPTSTMQSGVTALSNVV